MAQIYSNDIVALNVGGTSFCTSRKTLLAAENSFFSGLLSGRLNSAKDSNGAIFIDRDATLFAVILHYLRTRKIDLRGEDAHAVREEAEYYGITSLGKALQLVQEHERSSCGGLLFNGFINPPSVPSSANGSLHSMVVAPVLLITGHQNYLAVAYHHYVCVHRLVNAAGWEQVFTTPMLSGAPGQIALNVKLSSGRRRLLAVASGGSTTVWDITPADGESSCITTHSFNAQVDVLLFIGTQLVMLSHLGEISVWNAVTQQWKVQEMTPITSHATVNSTMILGCSNGSIYYIDMEKFPLRMKDNDLLVTKVYEDPALEAVTALSVYFPKALNVNGTATSLELAYGTSNGNVRVIADHPETLGRGFQLLQTFTVHRSQIARVSLTEKYLVSVCSDYNHVRSWTVTRFRGNLSTQTFPAPLASFHVMSLEMGADGETPGSNEIGPFGYHHKEQEDQVFIQRVAPLTSELYCRLAATGQRVCVLHSVDDSYISAHCVVDFDTSNRSAACERSYVFTGHGNGAVQMWDLTTAYEITRGDRGCALTPGTVDRQSHGHSSSSDGPSSNELLTILEHFDLRPPDEPDPAADQFSTTSSRRSLRLKLRDGRSSLSALHRMLSSPHPSVQSHLSASLSRPGGLLDIDPNSSLALGQSSSMVGMTSMTMSPPTSSRHGGLSPQLPKILSRDEILSPGTGAALVSEGATGEEATSANAANSLGLSSPVNKAEVQCAVAPPSVEGSHHADAGGAVSPQGIHDFPAPLVSSSPNTYPDQRSILTDELPLSAPANHTDISTHHHHHQNHQKAAAGIPGVRSEQAITREDVQSIADTSVCATSAPTTASSATAGIIASAANSISRKISHRRSKSATLVGYAQRNVDLAAEERSKAKKRISGPLSEDMIMLGASAAMLAGKADAAPSSEMSTQSISNVNM